MARDVSGWLPNTLGPLVIQVNGTELSTRRGTWNFIGATIADDSTNERTDFTFASTFASSAMRIANPGGTFYYTFAGSAIAANRVVTLPLLTGDDTLVAEAHTQTLTNKTLTSPVLTTPQINNPGLTFQYVFAGSAIVADRTVTLPLLTAGDTFVFEAFAATLTNKVLGSTTTISAAVKGNTAASSPFGIHGEATIDMADGNYTATAAEYACTVIKNGAATPMTQARTLTLPDATDANCYWKFIRNANGQGFGVVVTNVSAGTSVTIADALGAWVGIDNSGAFRMGPDT
jgi:hypothetical protein